MMSVATYPLSSNLKFLTAYASCLSVILFITDKILLAQTPHAISHNKKGLRRIPELQLILMAASVAVTLAVLVYSSWRDYVCREVSNKVWVVYAPIALALTLAELVLFEPSSLPWYGVKCRRNRWSSHCFYSILAASAAQTQKHSCASPSHYPSPP